MKLTNEDILSVLYTAKSKFITDRNTHNYAPNMCFYIQTYINIIFKTYIYYSKIKDIIPEFIPKTFGLNIEHNYWWDDTFWWNVNDIDSRINAFDKLIEIYKNKIKEL